MRLADGYGWLWRLRGAATDRVHAGAVVHDEDQLTTVRAGFEIFGERDCYVG